MKSKKIVPIVMAIALLAVAVGVFIMIYFFKEISPVSPESKERSPVKEMPEPNYAIPSKAIISGQMIEDAATSIKERRKALAEQELEVERARSIRRAEAFARQKEAEKALLSAAPTDPKQTAVVSHPQEEYKLPTDEEIKKMASEDIFSY
ncbi:MAG: hypothetical protein NT036_04205 [Candidatus Omnitrophica bacterium]|nr:hypothetical protein [Candidatus Omnitrophota bacterium]